MKRQIFVDFVHRKKFFRSNVEREDKQKEGPAVSMCNVSFVRLPDNVDGAISLLRRISHANAIRTAPVNALALPPSYRQRRYAQVNSRNCAWDVVLFAVDTRVLNGTWQFSLKMQINRWVTSISYDCLHEMEKKITCFVREVYSVPFECYAKRVPQR